MFSSHIQAITLSSKAKEESSKFDIRIGSRNAQEKRKQAIEEIGDDLNKTITNEKFAKAITDYDTQFSQLLLDLLAKIISEMGNGLGETKIGNVLYRFVFVFF